MRSCSPSGTATATRLTWRDCRRRSTAWASSERPPRVRSAFGVPGPSRSPRPAAGTTTATVTGELPGNGRRREVRGRSAGEDLVEHRLGLVLVGALSKCELADQDLPGLGEHPLLARGQ